MKLRWLHPAGIVLLLASRERWYYGKKCAIPDKKLWSKHQVRIFSDTDNYGLARFRARKAQETSHVEDSDENRGRKVIPPRRFREEEVLPSQPRWAKQAQSFHENGGSSQDDITSLQAKKKKTKSKNRSTLAETTLESVETDEDEELQPKRKKQKQTHLMLPNAPSFQSASTLQPQSSSTSQQIQDISQLFDGLERRILLKLDQIHADIKTAIGLQSVNQQSTSALDLFEVLEEPCKSVEELEELCEKLKAVEFRKKIIRYLCLQSAGSLGDGIRRMLKKSERIPFGLNTATKGEKENGHFSNC
ncbi:uncharacterized protein LOC127656779 [Xyrauchen texanus]|uniref:uncharacterized protein LOC127656779 n=1 Tax=Xyrauchen texanus TaxID=154827 RepID=UPI00224243DA|nr:uncharacterized protein LOC127656779 [Xyrauchen texanus]